MILVSLILRIPFFKEKYFLYGLIFFIILLLALVFRFIKFKYISNEENKKREALLGYHLFFSLCVGGISIFLVNNYNLLSSLNPEIQGIAVILIPSISFIVTYVILGMIIDYFTKSN